MLMLRHLGEMDAADRLEKAVADVIAEGKNVTYDLKPHRDDPSAVGTQKWRRRFARRWLNASGTKFQSVLQTVTWTTATSIAEVRLKPRKAQPFFCRHPWVRDTAIAALAGHPADGDVVDLVSDAGEWIARGVINSSSRIRVRLYSWITTRRLMTGFGVAASKPRSPCAARWVTTIPKAPAA